MSDRYQNESYGNRFRVTPSKAYHRHWQGYAEKTVVQPTGRIKIERTYVAPWRRHAISAKRWIAVKIIYFLLIAASVFFYLTALTQNVASNRVKYLAILGFPSGLFLLLSGIFVLLYISNRRNMTIGDHSAAADGLRILTLISSALLVLLSAATFIYALISGGQETGREIFCAVAELLSAAAVFAINRIETAMPYEDVPNETPSPENANIIR